MRVLVVEDDPKIASFVTMGLKQAGLAVDRAANAEQALELASTEPYDVAVVAVLGQSDLVATLSRRVAEAMVRGSALQLRELPFTSPTVRTSMLWHRRLDGYPAHRWLRDLIASVSKGL